MAPIKPRSKRVVTRTKASRVQSDPRGRYAPPTEDSTSAEDSTADDVRIPADQISSFLGDSFKLNKKDKRTIKHHNLLSKVREAGISKEKKVLKRRRPTKKLKSDPTAGLADALPDIDGDEDGDEWEGISEDEMDTTIAGPKHKRKRKRSAQTVGQDGKIVMKSLKHKPGAMKKKRAMEEKEKERFQKNLVRLMGGGTGEEGTAQSSRWAALRSFIGSTMERDKAFS